MLVDFYYDYISPYAWIAYHRAQPLLEARGAELNLKPVLFAGLLGHFGQKGPAEIEAKRRYVYTDILRLGHQLGLKLGFPPTHPFNPLPALRMTLAVEPHQRRAFTTAVFSGIWQQGKDPCSEEFYQEICRSLELNYEQLVGKCQTPQLKESLRTSTDEAVATGVFGVPCFVYEGSLFWGSDRVDQLMDAIDGKLNIDPALLNRAQEIKSSATRNQTKR